MKQHPFCAFIGYCLGHDYAQPLQPDPEPIDLGLPWLHKHEAEEWCRENGYTDLQLDDKTPEPHWWAFPPNGVMPEPIARAERFDRMSAGERYLR